MALIEVTITDGGSVVSIDEQDMIYITAEGTGSKIQYVVDPGFRKQAIVDETPAAIVAAASALYTLNLAGGGSIVIDANKVVTLSGTTEAELEYESEGAVVDRITSSDSYATVKAALNLLL